MRPRFPLAVLVSAVLVLVSPAALADELPLGERIEGHIVDGAPAEYTFTAPAAGTLSIVVRSGDLDLVLEVRDPAGYRVEDGFSDDDVAGHEGFEQVHATLHSAGSYTVHVRAFEDTGDATFRIAASWIPFPEIAAENPIPTPQDPPRLALGGHARGSLGPGEMVWYAVTVGAEGVVCAAVLSEGDGDVLLRVFRDPDFRLPIDHSDRDLGGAPGFESVTFRAEPGRIYYLRVERPERGALPAGDETAPITSFRIGVTRIALGD